MKKCLDHGFNANQLLDSDTGECINLLFYLDVIHYLAKYSNFSCLEIFLGKDIDLDVINKNKESALVN